MSSSDWTAHAYALIVDDDGRVLALDDESGVRLPAVDVAGTDDALPAINAALRALVGIETVVVRTIEREVDETAKTVSVALELEPISDPEDARAGTVWLTQQEGGSLPLPAEDRALVDRLVADRPPPERPDWARRGWFAEASGWIERTLAEHSRTTLAPVEQISSWCMSSILRVETDGGRVYFKATALSPLFGNEGSVTRGLSSMFPHAVPRPIAVDAERRWMLLDDFGEPVGWGADIDTRMDALAAYGRIQLEASARLDELLALGVLDRRATWLAPRIKALLDDPGSLGVDERELADLELRMPRLVADCERLAAGPVPESLVHGDLHLANVARPRDDYVFFDWTDACLSHPFLDLLVVMHEDDEELRTKLRDAYFEVWSSVATAGELLELWRLAEPIACLNQVISYRSIVDNIERESAPDLEPMIAVWLRKALAASEKT